MKKILFEFTARETPQHNGIVERAYQTLYNRVRAMLNTAGFNEGLRNSMWAECARTATDLENVTVKIGNEKSPHELMFGTQSKIVLNLRIFGEVGVVKNVYSGHLGSKLHNKGITMIFMGYCHNHSSNTMRMYNVQTRHVVFTRDVVWLNMTYGHWKVEIELKENKADEEPMELLIDVVGDKKEMQLVRKYPKRSTRLNTEFRVLRSNACERQRYHGMANVARELVCFMKVKGSVKVDPDTFDQAWNHTNISERRMWRSAIKEELSSMRDKQVWEIIDKEPDMRILNMKWVFKLKNDGRYRARLVAMGFRQLAGVDYHEAHAPVLHEVSLRLMLIKNLVREVVMRNVYIEVF